MCLSADGRPHNVNSCSENVNALLHRFPALILLCELFSVFYETCNDFSDSNLTGCINYQRAITPALSCLTVFLCGKQGGLAISFTWWHGDGLISRVLCIMDWKTPDIFLYWQISLYLCADIIDVVCPEGHLFRSLPPLNVSYCRSARIDIHDETGLREERTDNSFIHCICCFRYDFCSVSLRFPMMLPKKCENDLLITICYVFRSGITICPEIF